MSRKIRKSKFSVFFYVVMIFSCSTIDQMHKLYFDHFAVVISYWCLIIYLFFRFLSSSHSPSRNVYLSVQSSFLPSFLPFFFFSSYFLSFFLSLVSIFLCFCFSPSLTYSLLYLFQFPSMSSQEALESIRTAAKSAASHAKKWISQKEINITK